MREAKANPLKKKAPTVSNTIPIITVKNEIRSLLLTRVFLVSRFNSLIFILHSVGIYFSGRTSQHLKSSSQDDEICSREDFQESPVEVKPICLGEMRRRNQQDVLSIGGFDSVNDDCGHASMISRSLTVNKSNGFLHYGLRNKR